MTKHYISMSDFEYVADILRALRVFAPDLKNLSPSAADDLVESLAVSEAALRRAAAEIAEAANE